MNFFQVIYVSAASPQFKATDLPAILIQAREHNQKEGISGLLLFHEGNDRSQSSPPIHGRKF